MNDSANDVARANDDRRRAKTGPIVFDIAVDPVDPAQVAVSDDATGRAGTHAGRQPAGLPEVWLQHNRIRLALHRVRAARDAKVHPLLVLHGLGECTYDVVPAACDTWPGAIWGLDFTGHGHSTVPRAGGYTAELLMADVDCALEHLGVATIHGRGLGAYVALLVQGARPNLVHGVVLADGPGMVGGGIGPSSPRVTVASTAQRSPDPFALQELTVDLRPPEYALGFLHQAVELGTIETPVAIAARVRPPWLAALEGEPGVMVCDASQAWKHFLVS